MLTSLRTGALDLTANSQGAASGLVPELSALGLPFLFADADAAFKVLDGPVGEELAEKFAALGIIPLDWWDNGIRHITNASGPSPSPADLEGLKIRTPADPMTIDIFQALGAATEQIAFSELYVALQQGVVDGQENPLANIASSKLYEVNKYISLSAHKWEITPFLMSQIALGQAHGASSEAVKAAAKEAGELQRQLMEEADEKLLAEFKANPSVEVNEVDRAAFQAATAPVIEAWQEKDFGDFVGRVVDAAGVSGMDGRRRWHEPVGSPRGAARRRPTARPVIGAVCRATSWSPASRCSRARRPTSWRATSCARRPALGQRGARAAVPLVDRGRHRARGPARRPHGGRILLHALAAAAAGC